MWFVLPCKSKEFIAPLLILVTGLYLTGCRSRKKDSAVEVAYGNNFEVIPSALPKIKIWDSPVFNKTCSGVFVKNNEDGRIVLLTAQHCILKSDAAGKTAAFGFDVFFARKNALVSNEKMQLFIDDYANATDHKCIDKNGSFTSGHEGSIGLDGSKEVVKIHYNDFTILHNQLYASYAAQHAWAKAAPYDLVALVYQGKEDLSNLISAYEIIDYTNAATAFLQKRFGENYSRAFDQMQMTYGVTVGWGQDEHAIADILRYGKSLFRMPEGNTGLIKGRGNALPGDSGGPFVVNMNFPFSKGKNTAFKSYTPDISDFVPGDSAGQRGVVGIALTYHMDGTRRQNYFLNLSSDASKILLAKASSVSSSPSIGVGIQSVSFDGKFGASEQDRSYFSSSNFIGGTIGLVSLAEGASASASARAESERSESERSAKDDIFTGAKMYTTVKGGFCNFFTVEFNNKNWHVTPFHCLQESSTLNEVSGVDLTNIPGRQAATGISAELIEGIKQLCKNAGASCLSDLNVGSDVLVLSSSNRAKDLVAIPAADATVPSYKLFDLSSATTELDPARLEYNPQLKFVTQVQDRLTNQRSTLHNDKIVRLDMSNIAGFNTCEEAFGFPLLIRSCVNIEEQQIIHPFITFGGTSGSPVFITRDGNHGEALCMHVADGVVANSLARCQDLFSVFHLTQPVHR